MTIKTRKQLEETFQNGATPDAQDFSNLFESFRHQTDPDLNLRRANQTEAEEGNSNIQLMTPQRTRQAIIALTRLASVPALSREVDQKVATAISQLIDNAPTALDTLNELAQALNDDQNAYNTLVGLINTHVNRTNNPNPHGVTKAQVGLGGGNQLKMATRVQFGSKETRGLSQPVVYTFQRATEPGRVYRTSYIKYTAICTGNYYPEYRRHGILVFRHFQEGTAQLSGHDIFNSGSMSVSAVWSGGNCTLTFRATGSHHMLTTVEVALPGNFIRDLQ